MSRIALKAAVALMAVALPAICAAQTDDQIKASMPDGPGKAQITHACGACHSIKVVTTKRGTKDEWSNIVDLMITKGADIQDDQIDTVVTYLSTHYGPEKTDTPPPAGK